MCNPFIRVIIGVLDLGSFLHSHFLSSDRACDVPVVTLVTGSVVMKAGPHL